MAYNDKDVRRKDTAGEKRDMRYSNDECIKKAEESGKYGYPTQPKDEQPGYLGVDNLDRIRRENLRHKTR